MLNEEQDFLPIEQQTLTFYGKPIVVVRLPDGQPGVVLRFLCENLQIDTAAQTQRIRRTEAISQDLVFAQVETDGGSQRMAVLILHAVPFWLAGIDSQTSARGDPSRNLALPARSGGCSLQLGAVSQSDDGADGTGAGGTDYETGGTN